MSPHQNDAVMKRHLSQWKTSGQTQIAYCKGQGLKPYVFSYYKKKLNSAIVLQDSSQLVPVQLVSTSLTSSPKLTAEANTVQLSHSNGFSLTINNRTELSALKPLLELVRSIA